MSRALGAGQALGALLLAAGTAFGAGRVLLVAPRLGEAAALALEIPLMLVLAWTATGWFLRRFAVADDRKSRLLMGAASLVVLFAGEVVLAAVLFDTRPAAWLTGLAHPVAWPGLAAQITACLMPLLRRRGH